MVRGFVAVRDGSESLAISLGDGGGGALVDAGTAVDALAGVDDSDVVAGDGSLGADVHACSACDTLRCVNCNHCDYL